MLVEIKGLSEFNAATQAWIERVKKGAAEAAMGLAHEAFEQIIEYGPQNSGDFVANTKVSVGTLTPSFQPFVLGAKANQFSVGDEPAQTYAKSMASWKPGKLGQSIFIHSTAKHDDYYSVDIEKGNINLRPINKGADHIYTKAFLHTHMIYANIGKVQMDALRKFNL